MALSQFIEPYSAEQAEKFIKERQAKGDVLEQWEIDAYRFKPLHPSAIMMLSGDENAVARYVRSTCVMAMTSVKTARSIAKGRLSALDIDFMIKVASKAKPIDELQARILQSEQGIRLEEAKDFVRMICDVKRPIEELANQNIHYAANYYLTYFRELPQIKSAKDLPRLSEVSIVRDLEGRVVGEYSKVDLNGEKHIVRRHRRRFPKGVVPLKIKQALVAVEDERFWNFKEKGPDYEGHNGVDFKGMMRAVQASGSGQLQGASTITMQLAKNLLLYEDVFKEHYNGKRSLVRKLKEYILVQRLESALTKDEILNWYLNTINFGRRSQGVVMAAQSYFNKSIEDLSLSETAFLMGLPKSPNNLDPQDNYEAAVERRDTVLKSMKNNKFITKEERNSAREEKLEYVKKDVGDDKIGYAHFYMSAVEKQMKDWLRSLGQKTDLGFDITVPINHDYQKWAVESLQRGLLEYERSKKTLVVRAYEDQLPNIKEKVEALALERKTEDLNSVYPEILKAVRNNYLDGAQFELGVILANNNLGLLSGELVKRATKDKGLKRLEVQGGKKTDLKEWDVVLLQKTTGKKNKTSYQIASFTETQGGVVVLDNLTGAVLATSGGFSVGAGNRYKGYSGNRAFTAFRQPGSTVKPFTYLYALMNGVSPSTIIANQDLIMPRKFVGGRRACNRWNLSGRASEASFYSLRQGLEKSKNRVTVNTFLESLGVFNADPESLSQQADILGFGIDQVLGLMQSYGIYSNLDYACYPVLLGAEETTVVEMAGAYASFANLGIHNKPYAISDASRKGVTVKPFKQTSTADAAVARAVKESDETKKIEMLNLFRLRTMLQGVVKRGTARSISKWSNIVAGKTGTTNGNRDGWFVGFNKEITVAVWIGNVDNKSLGSRYEGGKVALPVFKDFMEHYYAKFPEKLEDKFSTSMPGMVTAQIEPTTGFKISEEFQADFTYYTGSNRSLTGATEYYASEEEMLNQTRNYYRGSAIAGELFFKNLDPERKKGYEAEYLTRRAEQTDIYYQNQTFCEEWFTSHPNHPDVIAACDKAQNYRLYLDKTNSFRKFYLVSFEFVN